MCRATTTSSRRNRRAVLPTNADDLCHAMEHVTLKNRALHQEETLPQTVSLGSSYKSQCSESDAELDRLSSKCPVTGTLSNVLDDYVVFPKVLGEGHYGCVRECIHRATRLTYACKSIDKSRIGRLDHLQREVALLMEIEHDNAMRMIDCYEDADYVHIITEKYTGGELFDKIIDHTNDAGCYSEEKTAKIIQQLLQSVEYLHANDIVHRDIKPENILFEAADEKNIKLIDYGLSRKHHAGEAPMSNPVGTAYYMAPELLKGKYDKACDVWSIGTIVYIMICGYPPFNGDTDPDIFEAIKRGQFDFPEAQWAKISPEAKDLIKCLLRRDTRKRFTAKEALMHPWIVNGGKKVSRVQSRRRVQPSLKYLRIP